MKHFCPQQLFETTKFGIWLLKMWKPIFLLAAAIRVVATVVDPSTGIAFERYQSAQGYNFGIALPQVPTTDFIAQIVSRTCFRTKKTRANNCRYTQLRELVTADSV